MIEKRWQSNDKGRDDRQRGNKEIIEKDDRW